MGQCVKTEEFKQYVNNENTAGEQTNQITEENK